jgi:hypothetical protein
MERDLSLRGIEDTSQRRARELVVCVVGFGAAVQEIDSVAGLPGCEVGGSGALRGDDASGAGPPDARGNGDAIFYCAHFCCIGMELQKRLQAVRRRGGELKIAGGG